MEEISVANVPEMEQSAQADVAQDVEVYAVDLLKPEPPKADAPRQEAPKQATEKPKAPVKSQEEIDRALWVRLKDAERKAQQKYESSPEYLAGKFAIDSRAEKDGISREEAAKRIRSEYEQAENQRLADNPVELVRTLKSIYSKESGTESDPASQAPPALAQFVEEAKHIVGEAYNNGLLPDGFTVTSDVVGELYKHRGDPIKLASYLASLKTAAPNEQDVPRERTPAPYRTTGENARAVEKDWRDVPSADFQSVVEEVKRQARDGKKVRI